MIADALNRQLPGEVALVERLAALLPRSTQQVNDRHDADAELVRIPGSDLLLAVTTDSICEEIESGLYNDPFLIGWVAVMASGSDLAAVGATPWGILVSETLPRILPDGYAASLQLGLAEACRRAGLPVFGGDTNRSDRLHIGTTALGLVDGDRPLTRRGMRPGDVLFATGPLGSGGAFALERFGRVLGAASSYAPEFRPVARLGEGRLVRQFGSACMDSSDGLIATLDELMRLNGVGVQLATVEKILDPAAAAVADGMGLPRWMLLAGPHGEFELIFSVRPHRVDELRAAAGREGWEPLPIGHVVSRPGLAIETSRGQTELDSTVVRDLFDRVGGDPAAYVEALATLEPGPPRRTS